MADDHRSLPAELQAACIIAAGAYLSGTGGPKTNPGGMRIPLPESPPAQRIADLARMIAVAYAAGPAGEGAEKPVD